MALQTKETPLLLVVPEFDKAIVAASYEEGQLRVEVDSSAGSIVALDWGGGTSNLATQIFIL